VVAVFRFYKHFGDPMIHFASAVQNEHKAFRGGGFEKIHSKYIKECLTKRNWLGNWLRKKLKYCSRSEKSYSHAECSVV